MTPERVVSAKVHFVPKMIDRWTPFTLLLTIGLLQNGLGPHFFSKRPNFHTDTTVFL